MAKRGKKRGRGQEKKAAPWRPLDYRCLYLVPKECWAEHGEEIEEMDTGIPRLTSVHCERTDGDCSCYLPGNFDIESKSPEQNARAAAELIRVLGLTPSRETSDAADAYIENRMDGVIRYHLNNIYNPAVVSAILDFVVKLRDKLKELRDGEAGIELDVSSEARDLLIERATHERQHDFRVCPTELLLVAIFGRFSLLESRLAG